MGRQVSYEKLLNLAHQRAIDGKGGLAASIAKMCLDQEADLTPGELDLTYQILRKLIDRVEVQIRRNIADILADRSDVPRDLLAFLTNDAVHVAYPIIVRSKQMKEIDLLKLAARQSHGHAIAVASRPEITEAVSQGLIERNEADVDQTLLRNETATIGRAGFEMLLERSIGNDTYQELIVRRHELPDDLARRMYSWVGDALRHHITRNFDIDSQTIDGAVDEAVWASLDEETGRVRADPAKGGAAKDVDPSATERAHRRATAYLRLLEEQGQTAFLSAVAQDTKLSERTLAQVFAPESPETAAIACTVLGMDVDKFIAVLQAFHDDAGWQRFTADGSLDKACDYFDRIDPLGAATVLRHWQETPPGENHA